MISSRSGLVILLVTLYVFDHEIMINAQQQQTAADCDQLVYQLWPSIDNNGVSIVQAPIVSAYYVRVTDQEQCAGMPVYKMKTISGVHRSFFIFKTVELADTDFWCEMYVPSNRINCSTRCDEVRFKMNNALLDNADSLYSGRGATPEEYDARHDAWFSNPDESITCIARNSQQRADNSVDQDTNVLENAEKALLNDIQSVVNTFIGSLDQLDQQASANSSINQQQVRAEINDPRPTLVPVETSSDDKNGTFIEIDNNSQGNGDEQQRTINTEQLFSDQSSVVAISSSDSDSPPFVSLSSQQQPDCPSILFQVYDDKRFMDNSYQSTDNTDSTVLPAKLTIQFDIVDTTITCPSSSSPSSQQQDGYPIYRDKQGMSIYLFRNVQGNICLDQLLVGSAEEVNCSAPCSDVRLEPSGPFSTPFLATRVLMLNPNDSSRVDDVVDNLDGKIEQFQFVCQQQLASPPQQYNKNQNTDVNSSPPPPPPPPSTVKNSINQGKLTCAQVFGDSGLCRNGATCQLIDVTSSSSAYSQYKNGQQQQWQAQCLCRNGTYGQFCEHAFQADTSFDDNNNSNGQSDDDDTNLWCLNGGTLLHDSSNDYSQSSDNLDSTETNNESKCQCREHYIGDRCETFTFNPCADRLDGQLAPHQDQPTLFYVCRAPAPSSQFDYQSLASPPKNDFVLHRCPTGLVFNERLARCDYDDVVVADTASVDNSYQQGKYEQTAFLVDDDGKCSPYDAAQLCQNGGLCERVDGEPQCMCPVGYSGIWCQFNSDDCHVNDEVDGRLRCSTSFSGNSNMSDNDDLISSSGRCVDLINGYVCLCPGNRYGLDCNTNMIDIPCTSNEDLLSSDEQQQESTMTRHSFFFDPSVIVECNSRGQLHLNRCPASLVWQPQTGSCVFPADQQQQQQGDLDQDQTSDNFMNINNGINNGGQREDPDPCLPLAGQSVCLNGGTCHSVTRENGKAALCDCPLGYEGDLCDTNVDDCASSPCNVLQSANNQSTSVCIDLVGDYYCVCENKFIDKDCSSLRMHKNPCGAGSSHAGQRGVHMHSYTREKYIVCNVEGYAQVMPCPRGLIWSEALARCVVADAAVHESIGKHCKWLSLNAMQQNADPSSLLLPYPFSLIKYVKCGNEDQPLETGNDDDLRHFSVEECPRLVPFFCVQRKQCVANYFVDCFL